VKNNDKINNIFFDIYCDAHYNSAKLELKIRLVYGEKKEKSYKGLIEPNAIA
jgi:hypothetical protein